LPDPIVSRLIPGDKDPGRRHGGQRPTAYSGVESAVRTGDRSDAAGSELGGKPSRAGRRGPAWETPASFTFETYLSAGGNALRFPGYSPEIDRIVVG